MSPQTLSAARTAANCAALIGAIVAIAAIAVAETLAQQIEQQAADDVIAARRRAGAAEGAVADLRVELDRARQEAEAAAEKQSES